MQKAISMGMITRLAGLGIDYQKLQNVFFSGWFGWNYRNAVGMGPKKRIIKRRNILDAILTHFDGKPQVE